MADPIVTQRIDPHRSWRSMTEKLPAAVAEALSVKGPVRSLVVKKAWVDMSKGPIDLDDLQSAKNIDGSLSVPLMAEVSLVENETGRVISHKKMRIGNVPAITPHGTFLVNGVEYNIDHQLRLDPSIYTVVKDNGQLVSAFNIGHGSKGKRLGLHYRPDAGVLDLTVCNSKVPLLPVLHALGIDDNKISQSLGGEFTAQNAAAIKNEEAETIAAASLLTGETHNDLIRSQEAIRQYFQGTRLDRHATAMVHGFKGDPPEATFGTVSPELLLMQAAKHMKVYRGDADPDDRNSLMFKTIHGIDDLLPGRFAHWKNRNLLANRIIPRLNSFDDVRKVIGASDVTPIIDRYFLSANEGGAGIVHVGEQNNPVQMHGEARRITMMGEGGISGSHSVPHSVRMVHGSQFGIIDPVHAPGDSKVGVVMHPAHSLVRIDNKLGTELIDLKTGKKTPVALDSYYNKSVAMPDQFTMNDDGTFKPKGSLVRVISGGKMKEARPNEVDFIMPSSSGMLSHSFRMIPMMGGVSGARAMIGGKMIEQALPLVNPDTQLVRARVDGTSPVEDPSSAGARIADIDGVVHAIEPGRIMVKGTDGKIVKHGIYDHFPSQSGAYFNHTPTVKVGDAIKKGQVLADSTFSKGGTLALGKNLVTAYLPYKGLTREDAIAISESAAEKLKSRHLEVMEYDLGDDSFASLSKFRAAYPGHITDDHAKRLDADGVVKVGEMVSQGESLILGLKRRMPSAEESILSKVSKKIYKPLVNSAVSWDRQDAGKVVRVEKLKNKIKVYVQRDSPARVGDKLSGLGMGSKGIISAIIPDAQVPVTRDGRRVELFFNGIGMSGRVNPAMYHEASFAKAAEKDGKPYYVDSFLTDGDYVSMAQKELESRGIPDRMDLVDPETNRVIPQVGLGLNHWMKLKHVVEDKHSARDTAGYDIDGQPLRGGEEGAKRTDPLQMYAILAHGAHHVLQDVAVNKSDRNDEMWHMLKTNQPLPPLKPSFAADKFLSLLGAAGINAVKSGDRITLMPMTDKEILGQSNGRITNPGSMKMGKDEFVPEEGGLFDPNITGGMKYGGKNAHISLPEPFVSPVMESAVLSLTNLKRPQFDGLVSGKLGIMPDGKIAPYVDGMATGGNAIGALLDKIDPKKEFDAVRLQLQSEKSRAVVDKLSKRGKYLRGLINYDMKPREAYLVNHVPVIPPHYRPVVPLPNGQVSWGGLNALYRDLMLVSDKLQAFQKLGPEHTSDLRASVYDALKAVQGLGDPLSNREYRGVLKTLGGVGSPKHGTVQRRLLGRPMDIVGRSTIIPDPDLGIDEVGIPEDMAWRIYQPFIVKEMTKIGISPLKAADEIDRRTERAAKALDMAMASRPALLNRAPSLHKFSVMAFNAKRVPGQAIQMQPLVFKGFNADVDGDSMIGNVIARIGSGEPEPISIEALFDRFHGEKPIRNNETRRVYNAKTKDPKQQIHVLSIVAGSSVSWLPIEQISAHFNLQMYRVVVGGIPAPIVASYDGSLVTIDLGDGRQGATTPTDAYGEYCPVARGIPDFAFVKPWERRFEELSAAVKTCVKGKRVVIRTTEEAEKIRFMGLAVGIEIRMFDTGSGAREILGFSMDMCAAEYVFGDIKNNPERLFCPQLKAAKVNANWAFRCAVKSGSVGTLAAQGKKPENSTVFSYSGRIYIEPTVRTRHRTLSKVHALGRHHLVPFAAPLYQKMLDKMSPRRRRELAARLGKFVKGAVHVSAVTDEDSGRIRGLPTALTMFSAVKMLRAMAGNKTVMRSDFYQAFYAVIHADVTYEHVIGVEELRNGSMTGYDVHVPGGQVFCEGSGLSMKNTMMVSVPISHQAVHEAATLMMPSKNLLNPGTHGIMMSPSKESVWGLWKMTEAGKKTGKSYPDMDSAMKDYLDGNLEATDVIKAGDVETTPGRIEVNSAIPENLRDYSSRFDDTKIKKIMTQVAKTDPKSYDSVVRKVTSSGDDASYYMGMSFGLSDLKPNTVIRDRIMKDADARYRSGPPTKERLLNIYGQAQKVLENQLDAHYAKHPNAIWDTIKSGALGKKAQAFQMIAQPGIVNDENGEPIPFPVSKSYSEGLGISDYIATMYGQRKGLIDRAISTAEPGEIHKETVTAAVRMQVDQPDCGASGAPYEIDDSSIYHRLLGEDLHIHGRVIAKRGDPVTHDIVDAARQAKLTTLNVRSPLNCESANGVCAADLGLDERGNKYPMGFNAGALAATTISEPLTQGVLSGFHHGNTAFSKTISGLDRVRQLIELPKMVAGEGPLSSVNGTVEGIKKLPSGDFRVTVGGHNHFVPTGMLVQVKKGDVLTAGSPLSSGVQNPHEILRTRGVGAARKYISDELSRTYKEGNNLNLDSRHFEVIARTLSDHAYVDDPGDAETLIRGDHMPLSKVEAYNKMLIAAKKKPIEYSPVLRGAVQAAVATDNWMARMNSRLISKKLQEAAGFGLSADVGPSGHPISRYIYGVNMGGDGREQHPETPSHVQGLNLEDLAFHGPVAVGVHEKQLNPVKPVKPE